MLLVTVQEGNISLRLNAVNSNMKCLACEPFGILLMLGRGGPFTLCASSSLSLYCAQREKQTPLLKSDSRNWGEAA